MPETNGNGNRSGLAGLLNSDDTISDVEIQMKNPDGTYSGVSFFFKGGPLDARTDSQYSHILQEGTRQKHSTLDKANKYVFRHRWVRSVGIDEPSLKVAGFSDSEIDLFKSNEIEFYLRSDKMWPIVRPATVQYLNEVSVDAESAKS